MVLPLPRPKGGPSSYGGSSARLPRTGQLPAIVVVRNPDPLYRNDHPDNTAVVGLLPVMVTPTTCNKSVGRVLIDRGTSLNLLSPELFRKMQVGERKLIPSMA